VHCGFCTATCPTYQLLGDELDGPRGRIYLIKQVLEGAPVTRKHAAAPGPLPDLPQLRNHLPQRRAVRPPGGHRPQDRRRTRGTPAGEQSVRWLLKAGLTSPLFAPAMKLGSWCARCCRPR
jgi:glycolate oxidase iron-sulfur subunit